MNFLEIFIIVIFISVSSLLCLPKQLWNEIQGPMLSESISLCEWTGMYLCHVCILSKCPQQKKKREIKDI